MSLGIGCVGIPYQGYCGHQLGEEVGIGVRGEVHSNESCVKCHQDLFPQGITDEGIIAHLHYDENVEELDLQCISCHLDAATTPELLARSNGGYSGLASAAKVDTSLFYKEATPVTAFVNYTEQVPGTLCRST